MLSYVFRINDVNTFSSLSNSNNKNIWFIEVVIHDRESYTLKVKISVLMDNIQIS